MLLDKVRINLETKKLLPSKSTSKRDISGNLPGNSFVAGPSILGITTDNGLLPLYPSEDVGVNHHDQDSMIARCNFLACCILIVLALIDILLRFQEILVFEVTVRAPRSIWKP